MPRVLLIEDDESQRFVAAYALKKAGHQVHEAPDGPAGMLAARESKPDVVVCDVMMPGMTGYDVVTAMRADAGLAGVPFILLTAMSDRKHMRMGMSSGADDYLTKPYRPDELCDAIDAVLARHRAQHQAALGNLTNVVEEALEQQKEDLGRRYELQLAQEVSARWKKHANAQGDLHYASAVLLLADLLGPAAAGSDGVAERTKRTQQQARDTLYLFGADHVLPYGTDVLGVFAGEGSLTTPVELRAARAALALAKAAPKGQPVAVGLHIGDVTLVLVHDGLHGDSGHSLVPGESLEQVARLRGLARQAGWRVAGSAPIARDLAEHLQRGRTAATPLGEAAVELLPAPGG